MKAVILPLDVANSLLISLERKRSKPGTQPIGWIPKNGVEYSLVAQTPQYDISSVRRPK